MQIMNVLAIVDIFLLKGNKYVLIFNAIILGKNINNNI